MGIGPPHSLCDHPIRYCCEEWGDGSAPCQVYLTSIAIILSDGFLLDLPLLDYGVVCRADCSKVHVCWYSIMWFKLLKVEWDIQFPVTGRQNQKCSSESEHGRLEDPITWICTRSGQLLCSSDQHQGYDFAVWGDFICKSWEVPILWYVELSMWIDKIHML